MTKRFRLSFKRALLGVLTMGQPQVSQVAFSPDRKVLTAAVDDGAVETRSTDELWALSLHRRSQHHKGILDGPHRLRHIGLAHSGRSVQHPLG